MRLLLLPATLALSACNVTLATSNVAISTTTPAPSYATQAPSEQAEFVRCPNRPSKMVRPGFEDALCYD